MSHLALSLMSRLNQTESAVFTFQMLCFQRIYFQVIYNKYEVRMLVVSGNTDNVLSVTDSSLNLLATACIIFIMKFTLRFHSPMCCKLH